MKDSLNLKKNKADLKIAVEEIIKHPESIEFAKEIEEKEINIKNCFVSKDYKQIIHNLHILRDLESGIMVYESENNLIRDARKQTSENFSTKIAYQIQFLNMVRSAKILMEEYGVADSDKEKSNTKLDEMAKYFYQNIPENNIPESEKHQQKFLLEHNEILIENIGKLFNPRLINFRKDLQLTMDYANFEDEHYHLSTISKIDGKTIVQSDVTILGTTEEQKKYFKNLHIYNRNFEQRSKLKFNELITKTDLPEFFKKLSSTEQKLVYRNIDKLYEGSRVHNTQLRNIPGAKNAYNYGVAVWDDKEKTLNEKLSELRIGTILCTNKCEDSEEISKTSLKQLNEATGKIIHFNSLVTTGFPTIDQKVFDAANKAVKSVKFKFKTSLDATNLQSNVALNNFRIFSNNYYNGLEEILREISSRLPIKYEDIKNYLKEPQVGILSREYNLKKDELKTLSLEQQTLFKDLLKLKKLISSYKLLDADHKGLTEINTLASNIIDNAQKIHIDKNIPLLGNFINLISCKSGKDRTGMQALLNSAKSVEAEFKDKQLTYISGELAKTGHLQIMSAKQGGRQGCFGILPGTGAAFPKAYEKSATLLALPAAKFNKDRGAGALKKLKAFDSGKLFQWNDDENSAQSITQSNINKDPKALNQQFNQKLQVPPNPLPQLQPLKLSKDYSKKFVEIANLSKTTPNKEFEPILKDFVTDIKAKLTPIALNKEETSKMQNENKVVFGDEKIGFISITTDKDGKYSFDTKIAGGKGINCLYPIPREGAPGSYDLLKFENGQLKDVIYSTKGTSKLNEKNIADLRAQFNKSLVSSDVKNDIKDSFTDKKPKPLSEKDNLPTKRSRRNSI